MKLNHAQIVKDYNKLINMYNVPFDLTGGMVVEVWLMEAVQKGTKKACAQAILEILKYGFQNSDNKTYTYEYWDRYKTVSVDDCAFIKYIADTYLNVY